MWNSCASGPTPSALARARMRPIRSRSCVPNTGNAPRGSGGEQTIAERVIRVVGVLLLWVRDVGRFAIGALHQADGRREWHERLEVGRRPSQVGLQTEADALVARARVAKQRERGIDVPGLFDVDPEERAGRFGLGGETVQSFGARIAIDVEAKVRGLDGDVRRELAGADLVEKLDIVSLDVVRFRGVRHTLAECGDDRAERGAGEGRGGVER